MSAATRPAGAVLAGVVLVGALAVGCSDEDPSPAPEPSPSASTEPTASTGASEPAESTEPAVTPATGLLLEEETSRMHAPDDAWSRIPDVVTYASAVGRDATTEVISLSDRENFASPASLAEQVRFHRKTIPQGATVERLPDVLLDGAPAYYVRWFEKGDTVVQHDVGLDHEGQVISIHFDLNKDDPEAADALVASVLASFEWR